jgi:hypothetical protein
MDSIGAGTRPRRARRVTDQKGARRFVPRERRGNRFSTEPIGIKNEIALRRVQQRDLGVRRA